MADVKKVDFNDNSYNSQAVLHEGMKVQDVYADSSLFEKFVSADKNRDGILTNDEIYKDNGEVVYNDFYPGLTIENTKGSIETFRKIDLNKDGTLERTEILLQQQRDNLMAEKNNKEKELTNKYDKKYENHSLNVLFFGMLGFTVELLALTPALSQLTRRGGINGFKHLFFRFPQLMVLGLLILGIGVPLSIRAKNKCTEKYDKDMQDITKDYNKKEQKIINNISPVIFDNRTKEHKKEKTEDTSTPINPEKMNKYIKVFKSKDSDGGEKITEIEASLLKSLAKAS